MTTEPSIAGQRAPWGVPDWLQVVLRSLLGGTLLAAAVMKVRPHLWQGLSPDRATAALIGAELLLGLWLVCGLYGRAAWWTSLVAFGILTGAAGFKIVARADSCGCLGTVPLSPWWALTARVGVTLGMEPEVIRLASSSGELSATAWVVNDGNSSVRVLYTLGEQSVALVIPNKPIAPGGRAAITIRANAPEASTQVTHVVVHTDSAEQPRLTLEVRR